MLLDLGRGSSLMVMVVLELDQFRTTGLNNKWVISIPMMCWLILCSEFVVILEPVTPFLVFISSSTHFNPVTTCQGLTEPLHITQQGEIKALQAQNELWRLKIVIKDVSCYWLHCYRNHHSPVLQKVTLWSHVSLWSACYNWNNYDCFVCQCVCKCDS